MHPKVHSPATLALLALLIAALLPAVPTLAVRAPDPNTIPAAEPTALKTAGGSFWTSGWVDIAQSECLTFSHNLGGDVEDYAVQLWFRDTLPTGYGVNNRGYGSVEDNGVWSGVFWRSLTNSTLNVCRQPADTWAEQVRVWIWISEPILEYCTAWASIGAGSTVTVAHNLGGNVDDYVVKLWFRDPGSPVGIHQTYYGGAEGGGELYGAYWHGLDTIQVQVSRYDEDIDAKEFRLCVSTTDPPDWDSGWVDINQDQTLTLQHHLGTSPTRYVVRMEFKAPPSALHGGSPETPMILHQYAYGGDASNVLGKDTTYLGANWQNLTNTSIDVYRWADDPYAAQVRVRIWLRRLAVHLPGVMKNYP